jgi:hypothetical protein
MLRLSSILCIATTFTLACCAPGCSDDRDCPTGSGGDAAAILVKPDGSGTYATIQDIPLFVGLLWGHRGLADGL